VLQLLVEEVSGRPFAEYMRETVLEPLGMVRATFDWRRLVAENRIEELATSYDRVLVAHPHRRYSVPAAVSLYATPRDVARFGLALVRGNPVLERPTMAEMLTPQPGTSGSWGLGHTIYVTTGSGHVIGHDGGTYPASGTIVRVNPATGNGIVAMVSGGSGIIERLGDDWLYWETGLVTRQARREVIRRRLVPASVAILLGSIVLLVWSRAR
jgi:CubicO group peptidase (beta-lactamase class C family)